MWLALETATDRASVAVGRTAAEALEESLAGARRHAGALLPMVEAALRRRGVGLGEVTGLVVSDGPGSFTGLRVGVTAAKALARARGLPLHTAPSLMARAAVVAGAGASTGLVLAVADALRGEVYAGAFRFAPGRVTTELEPGVFRPEALTERGLAADLLVGEVPPAVREALERATGLGMVVPPEGSPRATALIALTVMAGGAREVPSPSEWEPVYGRPAEAQARWEIAHGRPLPDPAGGAR